jgi:hypothetical protein
MLTPENFDSSSWTTAYLQALVLHTILPSLLPALALLLIVRIKYGLKRPLLLPLLGVLTLTLGVSGFFVAGFSELEYFLLGFTVPAFIFDVIVLSIVGGILRLVLKRKV